jgi:hypothetical protein
MTRNILSLVLVAALPAGSLAPAPAFAANRDADKLATILFGAAALAIIAHGVQKKRDRRHHHVAPAPPPRRAVLPARCVRNFNVRGQTRRLMPQRCLAKNNVRMARLPGNCFRQFNTNRGFRQGYAPRCLRRAGYAIR